MNKKIIIGAVGILAVAAIAFVVLKLNKTTKSVAEREKEAEQTFKKFSEGLTDLGIEYKEIYIDTKGYDVIAARMYSTGEKSVAIYYLDTNSKNYEKSVKKGYIVNSENKDLIVSGIIENGYLFYLEQDFPKSTEVYNLFKDITNVENEEK